MTFADLWEKACRQNPAILHGDGTVRLKVEGLHKAMKLAWETGHTEGVREGKRATRGNGDCGLGVLRDIMGMGVD